MLFNTFDFLLFFAIVFVVQLVLPHRPRNVFLLGASWFFYGCWDWRFLLLLIGSSVFDYFISHRVYRAKTTTARRRWMWTGIAVNLSVLGFFKYCNFFIGSARGFLATAGIDVPEVALQIVLPVGISFYTFQSLSCTIDIARGQMKPLDNFIDFALYLAFFPQLVAGPIERGIALAPQMLSKPPFSWENFQAGCSLVLVGLFKKAVLADNVAPIADAMFALEQPTGPQLLLGVYAFAFQIYGDFAGYTDIARGLALMLGYHLMLNFRLPYLATNPSDFWQRWHISLSNWLRNYLYIPLGGNRHGLAMTCRNLMITMLLGGLWHGANWTFVIWGAYHGVLLVAFHLWQHVCGKHHVRIGSASWLVQVIVMFHLTCLGWLFFRCESWDQLVRLVTSASTSWSWSSADDPLLWQLLLFCGPVVVIQFLKELSGKLDLIPRLSLLPRTAIYAATLWAVLSLGSFGGKEFIYFQF